MKIFELVPEKSGWHVTGDTSVDITAIESDSRKVRSGGLFVAVRGFVVDGHDFIDRALSSGAVAIVAEEDPQQHYENICWVRVPDARKALALLASAFYGHPSSELNLIGVTGTNGKTTTVMMLDRLFTGLGYKTGLISTVMYSYPGFRDDSSHTTPDPIRINRLLSEMVSAGCSHAFMEVSSHAADQDRIAGLKFTGAVFTNITHDHLDYHKTFKAYIEAKKKFFDQLDARAFALVNSDDPNGKVMVQNSAARKLEYALKRPADFHARILEQGMEGLHLLIDGHDFYSGLVGTFNAYNLLAIYGVARSLGESSEEILRVLSALPPAPGRFEIVRKPGGPTGVVDYAHTPDALEQVLKTISRSRQDHASVITVIGCGGDRDKEKRPVMAAIAAKGSDKVILTSDNPRTEDPEAILDQMWAGLSPEDRPKVFRITDRKEAIRMACGLAKDQDVVLVAGKGHEKYQEINGVRTPFDDLQELKAVLLKDI